MGAYQGMIYCVNNHQLVGVVVDDKLPRPEIQKYVSNAFRMRNMDLVCPECASRKFWVALLDDKFADFKDAVPDWVQIPPSAEAACLVLFPKNLDKNNKPEKN